MPTKEEMYRAVRDFVMAERQRLDILPEALGAFSRPEGSCFATGEFRNFLYGQLVYTHEGHGGWHELVFLDVLQGVFDEVQTVMKERLARTA